MYSIRAVLQKQPVAIAASLRSILYVLVLMQIIQIDAEQLAGIALAAEAVLGLFAYASVTPNVVAAEQVKTAAADAATATAAALAPAAVDATAPPG